MALSHLNALSSGPVEEILEVTGTDGNATVVLRGEAMDLRGALSERLELTQLHPAVVRAWAHLIGAEALKELSKDAAELRAYAEERQLIDLLRDYPGRLDAAALAGLLHPLQTRLHSIASSQTEIDDEVHLTISTVGCERHGRRHLVRGSAPRSVEHAQRRSGGSARTWPFQGPSGHRPERK